MSESIDWEQHVWSVAGYDLQECEAGLEDAVFSSLLKTSSIHNQVAKACT